MSKSSKYVKDDIVYYHVECDCGNTVDGSVGWYEWNSTDLDDDDLHDAIWMQEKCPVCLDWPVLY